MISSIKISFSCPFISIYLSIIFLHTIVQEQSLLLILLILPSFFIFNYLEVHSQRYIIMIQPQYKQSEKQEGLRVQISEDDILAFLPYQKVSTFLSTHQLPSWDYDVNYRAQRQFYINQRNQHSRIKKREESDHEQEKSNDNQLSSKKSGKSKVQSGKKSNLLMIQTPQTHLVSKIQGKKEEEINERNLKQAEPFQFKLPMHSKFSHQIQLGTPSQPSKPLKDEEKIDEEEIMDIPNQKSSEKIEISVLPIIQKQSRKIQYYGSKEPQISTLNDFMVKPLTYEFESKSIHSKIDQYSKNSSKKSKHEKSEVASPLSLLKEERKEEKPESLQQFILPIKEYKKKTNLSIPQMKNRYTQSVLINTEQSQKEHKDSEVSAEKTKSKSKSKVKKIKDSTMFKRKPRMNHSPCFGQTNFKVSESPELPHEPITHMDQKELKFSHNSAKKSISHISHSNKSSTPIPVEDYDSLFDNPKEKEDLQFNASEVDENIDISKPYGDKGRKEGQTSSMLPYYQIPIYPLKKNTPQNPPNKEKVQSEKEQKTPRRKIFSTKEKGSNLEKTQQKGPVILQNTESSDLSQYTSEEMRMILGARGNKYKETIVKQYIKLQREKQRNKID